MTTLHLLSSNHSFDLLMEQAFLVQANDTIVLLAEAVYCAASSQNMHRPVYVLQEDLILRGIEVDSVSGRIITYSELLTLLEQFQRSISW